MAGSPEQLDVIFIRDLLVRCIIGIRPEEREKKQDVLININLYGDFHRAGQTDAIADALDYAHLKKRLVDFCEKSSFNLIETLAERLAAICLESDLVKEVEVQLEKPTALRFARTVGIKIRRYKKSLPPKNKE